MLVEFLNGWTVEALVQLQEAMIAAALIASAQTSLIDEHNLRIILAAIAKKWARPFQSTPL